MFKGIRKARIQAGYPKLAISNQQLNNYFPTQTQYPTIFHSIKPTELIVLVCEYNNYRGDAAYKYIPFNLLVDEKIPVNRALTWAARSNHLPGIPKHYCEIIT